MPLNRRPRRTRRKGYVLLMTLVLIVIAVLSQAGLARRSLQLALDAKEAQEELQRRWFAASCREHLLQEAEATLIRAEEDQVDRRPQWPSSSHVGAEFAVAGMSVRLRLADEGAKFNLNTLYARQPDQVRLKVTQLASGLTPQLRPDTSRAAKLRKRWFASWGQVFDLPQVFMQHQSDSLWSTTATITCWGDGKPNIRRASNETIEAAASLSVGRDIAHRVVEERATFEGDLLLPELLAKLGLRRVDQIKLRGVLSDRSSCYSLWLELETNRRRWYYLWVQGDSTASGDAPILSFHW